MTVEGVCTRERGAWATAWGKMEKEEAGKDRSGGTGIRQEADVAVREQPVHMPRTGHGKKVPEPGEAGRDRSPAGPTRWLICRLRVVRDGRLDPSILMLLSTAR